MQFDNLDPLIVALIIFFARVVEVALYTMRAIAVSQGNRVSAFIYAFLQVIIWVYVVSKVLLNLDKTEYVIAFSIGFAFGTYIGIILENWLGQGHRIIRIFTRKGRELVDEIRKEGFAATLLNGEGKDGPVQLLMVEAKRKKLKDIVNIAKDKDPDCYYSIDSANVIPRV